MFNRFAFLKQGQRSFTEYVTEIEALLKYELSFIDTPRKKNEKFVSSLKDIGKQLIYHLDARFKEIVNMAIMNETMYLEKKLLEIVKEEPKASKGGKKEGRLEDKGKSGKRQQSRETQSRDQVLQLWYGRSLGQRLQEPS